MARGQNQRPSLSYPLQKQPSRITPSVFSSIIRPDPSSMNRRTRRLTLRVLPQYGSISRSNQSPRVLSDASSVAAISFADLTRTVSPALRSSFVPLGSRGPVDLTGYDQSPSRRRISSTTILVQTTNQRPT